MNNPENLYLEGEEKFGFFTSRMYNFAKKMVKPHLMSRKNFEEIAQNLGIHARIMEDSGNILCEFKVPEKTDDSIS